MLGNLGGFNAFLIYNLFTLRWFYWDVPPSPHPSKSRSVSSKHTSSLGCYIFLLMSPRLLQGLGPTCLGLYVLESEKNKRGSGSKIGLVSDMLKMLLQGIRMGCLIIHVCDGTGTRDVAPGPRQAV